MTDPNDINTAVTHVTKEAIRKYFEDIVGDVRVYDVRGHQHAHNVPSTYINACKRQGAPTTGGALKLLATSYEEPVHFTAALMEDVGRPVVQLLSNNRHRMVQVQIKKPGRFFGTWEKVDLVLVSGMLLNVPSWARGKIVQTSTTADDKTYYGVKVAYAIKYNGDDGDDRSNRRFNIKTSDDTGDTWLSVRAPNEEGRREWLDALNYPNGTVTSVLPVLVGEKRCLTFCCAGSTINGHHCSYSPPAGVGVLDVSADQWTMFEPYISMLVDDTDEHTKAFATWETSHATTTTTADALQMCEYLFTDKFLDLFTHCSGTAAVQYRTFEGITHIAVIGDVHGNGAGLQWNMQQLWTQDFFLSEEPTGADVWQGKKWKLQDTHLIIFTGDILDRGKEQIECLHLVYTLFAENHEKVVLCRGNHEYRENMWDRYGFTSVLKRLYGNNVTAEEELLEDLCQSVPVLNLLKVTEKEKKGVTWLKCMHGYGPIDPDPKNPNAPLPFDQLLAAVES